MRHIRFVPGMCLAFVLALLVCPSLALAADSEPALSEATSAIVVDSAGNVLYEKNPDDEINMASVTKVMTAVCALESGVSLDTTVTCVGCSLDENAMVAGYKAGDTSSLRDLMRAMLVYSANDAAYEVAVATGGTYDAFIQKMNDKAAELGMTHTHFVNPHGLDADGHHSSVHDLAILARYAMTNYPFIADTVRLTSVTVPVGGAETTLETSDELLYSYSGMLGIKTGAGNYVTAFMGCARRKGTTLYTVVLGCQTKDGRFTDTAALLDWAFENYRYNSYATAGVATSSKKLAYNLAYSCLVSPDADAYGLTWQDLGETTHEVTSIEGLAAPGQVTSLEQWKQGGRVVATSTNRASYSLVPTSSGLGVIDEIAPQVSIVSRVA
jgi:serine-type D-Ala-D-Ala carboxypeptidase (penicillin-binding protein 5/6)